MQDNTSVADVSDNEQADEAPAVQKSTELSSFHVAASAARGVELHLESPVDDRPLYDENGDPVFVTILSDDHPKIRKHDRAVSDRRLAKLNRGKKADLTSEMVEQDAIDKAIAATTAWNLPPLNGVKLPFSEKNARRVYSDPGFVWIVEQILTAMKDRKRFFEAASTT